MASKHGRKGEGVPLPQTNAADPLGTTILDGRKLGDLTGTELLALARQHEQSGRHHGQRARAPEMAAAIKKAQDPSRAK
jgi:hypothetical protein